MQPNTRNIHKGVMHHASANKHLIMGYLFLALVFAAAISSVYYWEHKRQDAAAMSDPARHVGSGERTETNGLACVPEITLARHPLTSETREFSSPCLVLPPWEAVERE